VFWFGGTCEDGVLLLPWRLCSFCDTIDDFDVVANVGADVAVDVRLLANGDGFVDVETDRLDSVLVAVFDVARDNDDLHALIIEFILIFDTGGLREGRSMPR
jgi:hypothetical protein